MANYRNISVTFWTDSKVDDEFTPEDKYFYLYLLTNPHTNICGCYEISMKQMERETGYNSDTVNRLIKRMKYTHCVIDYSEKTKEMLLLNWGKYNWTGSENVKKAVLKVAEYIKCEHFKDYVMNTVSIGYPYRIGTSVSDTDTESDTDTDTDSETDTETEYRYRNRQADKPKHSARFVPPTFDEVNAYCVERQNGIDAQAFIDFYESKGWMIGKDKMKSWKAAVRTWENRRKAENPRQEVNQYAGFGDEFDI